MPRRFHSLHTVSLGGLLAALMAACTPSDPVTETTTTLANAVFVPAYSQWQDSVQRLQLTTQAFCTGKATLEETRQQFLLTQTSWASLQALLLGPLSDTNRLWQIQFWPDKKNLVARQVEGLLQNTPQPDLNQVQNGSVVTQGLSAYEYILFDPAATLSDPQRQPGYCALASAISTHQQQLAAKALVEWQDPAQGLAQQLQKFPNSRYASATEALGDILRTQVTALDGLKKKLGLPLGRPGQGIPQPYQAEAWRSNASLLSLEASLDGAEQLWHGTGDNGLRRLLDKNHEALAKRIDQAYAQVGEQLQRLKTQPLASVLANDEGRTQLNALYDSLNALHRLHQGELAQALGIQIGFNAHDGD